MPYTVTTHTATGTFARELGTIEQVDQFVSRVQYRGESSLLAVADDPLTLIYLNQVTHFTIDGVTQADIEAYEADRREKLEAAYQEQLARKKADERFNAFPSTSGLVGNVYTNQCDAPMNAESSLARAVR